MSELKLDLKTRDELGWDLLGGAVSLRSAFDESFAALRLTRLTCWILAGGAAGEDCWDAGVADFLVHRWRAGCAPGDGLLVLASEAESRKADFVAIAFDAEFGPGGGPVDRVRLVFHFFVEWNENGDASRSVSTSQRLLQIRSAGVSAGVEVARSAFFQTFFGYWFSREFRCRRAGRKARRPIGASPGECGRGLRRLGRAGLWACRARLQTDFIQRNRRTPGEGST